MRMTSDPISPREFGRLEAEVRNAREDIGELRRDLGETAASVRKLHELIAQVQGGWRALALVGAAAGAVGAFAGKVLASLGIIR